MNRVVDLRCSLFYLISIFILSFQACCPSKKEVNTNVYIDNKLRNYEDPICSNHFATPLRISDTFDCAYFRDDRRLGGILSNKMLVVEEVGTNVFSLTSGKLSFWPCNLPKSSMINIGDTVLVSGIYFDIFGSERLFGYPTFLTKLAVK